MPISLVMGGPDDPKHTAWLFTRGSESVCLEVGESAGGYRLSVRGPGRGRATHEFDSGEAALSAAREYRIALVRGGFVLHRDSDRRESATLRTSRPLRRMRLVRAR